MKTDRFKYKKTILILIVLIMLAIPKNIKAYYEEQHYEYSTPQQSDEEIRQEAWVKLNKDNPLLYNLLIFFNPPILNNLIGNIITIMVAVGSLAGLYAFEGEGKIIMFLIIFYSWGRIICLFIMMNLVGRGVLPP